MSRSGEQASYPPAGTPSRRLWVDAGPGAFAALRRHMDPAPLTAVRISHLHADHGAGLPHWNLRLTACAVAHGSCARRTPARITGANTAHTCT
ncbi:MBL fold metallo-hydrolase [Streptomyces olivaceoviridis]|uniref:MBL fold metallo-hydrolase n=1 Tax=Streptomyces olivaceoviridis TaxID=1921 RepID=UPI003701B5C1